MSKTLVTLIATLLFGLNAYAQDYRNLAGNVFQGVTQNLIIGGGDSAECGAQTAINNAIGRALSRGNYYPSNNLDQCLQQKRWERERLQQQAMMQQQQAMQRYQQLEDEKRRYLQQMAEEARRMAPKCSYSTKESIKGGVTAPKEESRDCSGQRYEDFIQRMTLK